MTTGTAAEPYSGRSRATRDALLDAAERLYAEQGIDNVSHRQITAGAGQGNNAAIAYHFGTSADLVRAVVLRHAVPIDDIRRRSLAGMGDPTDIRSWLDCLVRPLAEHLEQLGVPTWYARLAAQLTTDPRRRAAVLEAASGTRTIAVLVEGLGRCVPDLPEPVRAERSDLARLLVVQAFAEREAAVARGLPTPRATWAECADGVTDALVGVWLAPVTGQWRTS
ncbi:TetR/AcrR family transcriptional regulator [Nakamurella leprariae]|uniref:TetR/AcrR family transcriptional regulator n=1 Tax=Nakamurella leprariae TaxID=2803911 RepID=A0A938YJG4_9ACTN|nr:TetR/AcrR family transcriptional regulator [Nakamurella leprariae]MBM9469274.1 TetR/AcrR family transcriptional regulator [Nakamurella leprariae]